MFAIFQRLFGWLFGKVSGLFGQGFLLELAKWSAKKIVVLSFLTVGIYIVFNNVLVWLINKILDEVGALVTEQGSFDSIVIQLSGLGAYFANQMRLVDAFAIIVTGFTIRAVRQFLPF